MANKPKGGLGRGLDSLIAISGNPQDADNERLTHIATDKIQAGRYQARQHIDPIALQELADSIQAQGLIQPIIVREYGLDGYELIAGERRWRAAQLAGLREIPVIIKPMNDKTAMAIGLIENIQRENLNPVEEAQGFRRLIDEFGLTHEAIAEAIGRSRSAISNSLRLLKLPEPIQKMLFDGHLEMGHARALLPLPIHQQLDLAQKTVAQKWSVRETEKRAQQAQTTQNSITPNKMVNPDVARLNEVLTQQLGVMSEIKTRNGKKGKIILSFANQDEFDLLMQKLAIELPQ